jgi:lysozyme
MVNQATVDLVKKFEGCVLHAYQDVVGVWTIGYGHTSGVKKGQTITQAQAEKMLKDELSVFAEKVQKLIKVSLNENQFGALVSFAYNVGVGALATSTLLKLLNAKNFTGASNEFARWNKAGGRVLAGLTKRRAEEKALFNKPVPVVVPAFHGLLKQGSVGADVKLAQKKLGISADGIFGSGTKAKVIAFQKAHKLDADGIIGKVTWNTLF